VEAGKLVLSLFFAGFGYVQKTDEPSMAVRIIVRAIVLKDNSVKVAGPDRLKNLFGPVLKTGAY
jgi:hypothetical protein